MTQFPSNLPLPLMLLVAPLLGLVFVMFLPLIGFVMMFRLLGELAYRHISSVAVRALKPSWTPVWAFLHRSRPATPPPSDEWSRKIAKTLDDK